MIFDTKAIFLPSAGRKKVIYLWTKGPAEDRAVYRFLREISEEFRSQEVYGGRRHTSQATVVQFGVSCFSQPYC